MRLTLLEILRCPFCGGHLTPVEGKSPELRDGEMTSGILGCACCSYPVVDGIPVLLVDWAAETATQQLGAGEREQALLTLLGLDEARHDDFRRLVAKGRQATYRELIEILNPDAEGTYFIYRFSDPTYLASQALVRAIGQNACAAGRRVLDVCGGSGHLTRTLRQLSPATEVILADAGFAGLWMARRVTAPDCQTVCCDVNNPLPFEQGAFSLVVCSDAYHYIWSKRLLACEMMRLAGDRGTVVLPHLHNARCENFSAGMPLTPAHYRSLFANLNARLFRESPILTGFINDRTVDLSVAESDEALAREPALSLVATRRPEIFRTYDLPDHTAGVCRVNPIYRLTADGDLTHLELQFPSEMYAREYAACLRYLPERLTLPTELLRRLEAGEINEEHRELARKFVLLDLPEGYC
ncbi:MAG TPA: methyltransferase domain-containing protein [Blastocatellia bacterium]|nr:methyltransferase domain-containing protein [Blastocatellia bacterium]